MSLTYGDGFFFFEKEEWRRGPLPLAADARYRPPRAGDILKTDEASLRKAHEQMPRPGCASSNATATGIRCWPSP